MPFGHCRREFPNGERRCRITLLRERGIDLAERDDYYKTQLLTDDFLAGDRPLGLVEQHIRAFRKKRG